MLSLKRKKITAQKKYSKEEVLKRIYLHPQNSWGVNEKVIYRSIDDLFSRLNQEHLNFFGKNHPLIFIPTSGVYSCALSFPAKIPIILMFPDLIKKLSAANPDEGLAILAHELGHIFYRHSDKNIPILEAQIEADDFAYQVGLARELTEVLLQFNDLDTRTRVSYLTSKILSIGH